MATMQRFDAVDTSQPPAALLLAHIFLIGLQPWTLRHDQLPSSNMNG